MLLTVGTPEHVPASDLADPALPTEYKELVLAYGPGTVCNAWRLLPPAEVSRSYGLLVFARTLQGDDYAVDPAGRVWEIHRGEENALLADSLRTWFGGWLDGSAHESIRTPWFQPDGISWNGGQVNAVTAAEPGAVITSLVGALADSVELSWIQGSASVQAHLWWPSEPGKQPVDRVTRGNAWICATAVAAETTRAAWDLSLRIRTEGDAAAVADELEPVVRAKGWLIT